MAKDKKNIHGIIGTVVFHGILLAILLTFSFSKTEYIYPDPLGITVDFGEIVQGVDAKSEETPTEKNPQTETQETQANNSSEEVVTQDIEDAASINVNEKPSPEEIQKAKEEKERKEKEEEEAKRKMDAFFAKGKLDGKPGDSETGKINGTPGDPTSTTRGDKRGTPGSPYGNSDVTSWVKPINTQNCNKSIDLTVQIDALGNVKKIIKIETALSEQACIEAAKNAAKKVKFKQADADLRYAVITYDYSTSAE